MRRKEWHAGQPRAAIIEGLLYEIHSPRGRRLVPTASLMIALTGALFGTLFTGIDCRVGTKLALMQQGKLSLKIHGRDRPR